MAFFSKARKAVAIVVAVAVLAPCVLLCGFSASAGNTLAGKTALFVGDSIMAGWYDGDTYGENRGWSIRMQKYYDMDVTNAAKAGWALSTIREDYKGRIRTQLTDNQNNDYDYIILEGGINDIIGDDRNDDAPRMPVSKGAMTASDVFTADSFDVDTFAGAMEDLLCCAKTCFPNAKIGYIVTYQTPRAKNRGQASDTELTAAYFDLAKQICDKWDVSYLDFNTDAYTALFYPNESTSPYFRDDIHLNPAGYDMSAPYIAEWMETLTGGTEPSVSEVVPYGYEDVEAKDYTATEGPIHGNGSGRAVSLEQDKTNGSGQSMKLKMNQRDDTRYARTVVRQYGSDGTTANDYKVVTGRQYVVSFWAYSVEAREVTMRLGTIYSNISVYVGNGDGSNMNPIEAETVVSLEAETWTKVTLTVPFVIGADHLNAEMGENGGYLTLGALTADCDDEENIQYLYIDDVTVKDEGFRVNVSNIIRAPRTAALFCSDEHGTNDPDAVGQPGDRSAIYYNEVKDKYYAAMRVFGEYTDTGIHDTINFQGQGLRVMERGLLVGTDVNVTLGSKTLVGKVAVSGKDLNNYWTYNHDSNTLRYSVLLKNIPASRADENFVFRSFVKLGNGHSRLIVYSDIQPGLILRHVYDTICEKKGFTLKFFGDFNDSPASQNVLPFRDGFDARFTVVYPDDYGTDDGEVSLENIGSSILPSGGLTTYNIADNLVNKMNAQIGVSHRLLPAEASQTTYEILVGDTGRPESIEAAEELSLNANDFVVRRDESKIAIVANNTEGLELGVQYFINQYLTGPKATLDEVNYLSSAHWEDNKTTYTVSGISLSQFYIRNEKYPSLLVREAVENLRREAKILFGVTPEPINGEENENNLPIAHAMDYDGTRYFDNEIWVGPYQDEVHALFDGKETFTKADSNPATNNELTGVEDNGLLESECGAAGYKIWAEGGKLKVNGGSSYAIYVGVSKLCELLQRGPFNPNAETTGSYNDDYSLMDQYKLIFGDDFNYTGETDEDIANGLLKNWSLSSDTTPGMYYYGKDEDGVDLWDEQQRPGIYGDKDGTYYVKDGYLYEITKYAGDNLPYKNRNGNGQVWYAGRVVSNGRWSYQYGIVECRIIMGTRNGACSAVWNKSASMAPNGRSLEIDLYENFGQPDLFRANVHAHHATGEDWDGQQYGNWIRINGTTTRSKEAEKMDYYDTFHYIAYRWTKTYIAFYMDGKEFGRLNFDQMNEHEGDDQVMHTRVNLWLANGVGTGNYDGGYNPISYLTGADGAKNSYKNFKEKQVIDSVYLFQQKDGIFEDKRPDTRN